jgi:two-component system C4-dicarboxylate transport response regulator DctD
VKDALQPLGYSGLNGISFYAGTGSLAVATDLKVLLVEDDPAVLFGTKQALELAGFLVVAFTDAESAAREITPEAPAVVVCDVRLPGMDGVTLLSQTRSIDPDLAVILITGHGDIDMAVAAMRQGAYDFVEKPFAPQRLIDVVARAAEKRRLVLQVRALRHQLAGQRGIESIILGHSPAIQRVRGLVLRLAGPPANVLIQGETGTGKELVGRSLHQHSSRRERPFVAINCGGLPDHLFESEMFGYEPGAFTEAYRRRIGKIEHAHGGTLFLDEIESMPAAMQVKLLRVLQEHSIERMGSNDPIPVDFRVIAASKPNLAALVETGHFRRDLLYRLNVAVIDLPPLRERKEDIPLLFEHFVLHAARRHSRPAPVATAAQIDALMSHAWPGNVRELRNVACRFVLGLLDGQIGGLARRAAQRVSLGEQVDRFEQVLIEEALVEHRGDAELASRSLRISKRTLYEKIRKFGLSAEVFRSARRQPS